MTKKNYESYQDLMKRFRASERERVEKALDKLEEKIDKDLMLENIKEASLILAHLLDANVKTITLLLNFMESS
jgi:formiminotetrahydrofolate cyclodeaminase